MCYLLCIEKQLDGYICLTLQQWQARDLVMCFKLMWRVLPNTEKQIESATVNYTNLWFELTCRVFLSTEKQINRWTNEWMNEFFYIAHTKLPHKNLRVHNHPWRRIDRYQGREWGFDVPNIRHWETDGWFDFWRCNGELDKLVNRWLVLWTNVKECWTSDLSRGNSAADGC